MNKFRHEPQFEIGFNYIGVNNGAFYVTHSVITVFTSRLQFNEAFNFEALYQNNLLSC